MFSSRVVEKRTQMGVPRGLLLGVADEHVTGHAEVEDEVFAALERAEDELALARHRLKTPPRQDRGEHLGDREAQHLGVTQLHRHHPPPHHRGAQIARHRLDLRKLRHSPSRGAVSSPASSAPP